MFDFGGISINGETSAIDKFKLGFGGQLKMSTSYFQSAYKSKSFYFLVSNIELLLVRNKENSNFDTCVICLLKKLVGFRYDVS